MHIRSWSALFAGVAALVFAGATNADEFLATLTLDGLSFVSFQDEETLPIPAGSTIRFRFGDRSNRSNDSVPFTIRPEDVSIAPIPLSGDRLLRYELSRAASGVVRRPSGSRDWILQFTGSVSAQLEGARESADPLEYAIAFTTESASASNREQTRNVQVTGMRLVDGAWYAQIVGATSNQEQAYPKPGAAVYTVLSGRFDRFPTAAR